MFEGYLIQGWVTGPNYFLGLFLRPIGFGNNTRPFVPFNMVLKVFKERDIAGYLFHEFCPFCQNFFLLIYIYISQGYILLARVFPETLSLSRGKPQNFFKLHTLR